MGGGLWRLLTAAVLLGALAAAGQTSREQIAGEAATQSLAMSLAPPQHRSAASSSPPDSTGPMGITLREVQQGGLCQTGAPAVPVVELGIAQAHAAMLAGSLNCSALVAAYLQRIAAFDQRTQLNSIRGVHPQAVAVSLHFICPRLGCTASSLLPPPAAAAAGWLAARPPSPAPARCERHCAPLLAEMQRASELDAALAALRANGSSTLPPLFCVPLLVKDNIDAVGTATTAGE